MSVVLAVEGLRKRFGRVEAVKDVSFEIRAGELVGLVGPNGAGKSTTIQMISGQLLPDGGTVRIAGVDVVADPNGDEGECHEGNNVGLQPNVACNTVD